MMERQVHRVQLSCCLKKQWITRVLQ